jgi:hypothetical protein
MGKFNHAFDFAFEVSSDKEDASDVTADMLRTALYKRIEELDSSGDLAWQEAVDCFDTFEEDPDPSNAVDILRTKYIGTDLSQRKALARAHIEAEVEKALFDEGRLKDDD